MKAATDVHRAAFLDRDGVINIDRGYIHRREDFEFVPGALGGARRLHQLGYRLVVVSNQSGIGRGLYDEADFLDLSAWMRARFDEAGAPLAGVYYCPHHPEASVAAYRRVCACRKPAPGLILTAAHELGLDLGASLMFGDKVTDLQAAQAAGVPVRILLGESGIGMPRPPAASGLATAMYRRLDEALADPTLLAAIGIAGQHG